jgi:uncharacterized protein (DUF2141 family)
LYLGVADDGIIHLKRSPETRDAILALVRTNTNTRITTKEMGQAMVYIKRILKKTAFFGLFLIACLTAGVGSLFAQTLTIEVDNIEPDKGYLMVGVFNNKSNFPDIYIQGQRIKAINETMVFTFNNLPLGTYAVSVYQDTNENEELDKNFLGIPKERYGFSNNSTKPVYEICQFDFNSDMEISIRLLE